MPTPGDRAASCASPVQVSNAIGNDGVREPGRQGSRGGRLQPEIDPLHVAIVGEIGRLALQHRPPGSAAHTRNPPLPAPAPPLAPPAAASGPRCAGVPAFRTSPPPPPAPGRGWARPASAASDRSSARGRWRASAARRPTTCRHAGGDARPGGGTGVKTRSSSSGTRRLSRSTVAPRRRFCSTVCCTNSRQPSGDKRQAATDDGVGRLAGDVRALPHDLPGRRRHQAGDRVQRRGLARAVGAEQCDDRAGGHLQRHVGDADEIAVADGKVADGEKGCRSCRVRVIVTRTASKHSPLRHEEHSKARTQKLLRCCLCASRSVSSDVELYLFIAAPASCGARDTPRPPPDPPPPRAAHPGR